MGSKPQYVVRNYYTGPIIYLKNCPNILYYGYTVQWTRDFMR